VGHREGERVANLFFLPSKKRKKTKEYKIRKTVLDNSPNFVI
jgi:hypothetical protein